MFGEKLIQLRKDKKMSQRDLAAYLHLSQTAIGKYERGENEPDFSTLKKISSLFNVSIDYLVADDASELITITKEDRDILIDAFSKALDVLKKIKD